MNVMRVAMYALMTAFAVISRSAQAISATAGDDGSLTSAASASSMSFSSSSSSSSASEDITNPASSLANATSQVTTVWRDDDDCSATTQRSGCLFEAICDVCLSRNGCAIESTTGKCVSISRIDPSNTGVEYFWNGKAEYCDATDAACTACTNGTSDAPCYGVAGCFCLRQCELQPQTPLECGGVMSFSKVTYLLMVLMVLCSLSLFIHIRRFRINNAIAGRLGLHRLVLRRPRPRDQEAHPMALKLDNWKKDRVEHSEEFTNIELKSCFVQMDDSQRGTILHDSSSESGSSFCVDLESFECDSEREVSTYEDLLPAAGSEATLAAHVRRDGADAA